MAEIILSGVVIVLLAVCLRLLDRCRHCERTMLEMAANARAADEREFADFQRTKRAIRALQESGLGTLRDDDRRPLASDENPAWKL